MPQQKETRLQRAKKERMYFMGRAATSSQSAAAFIVTGQSGKVWTVTIPSTDSSLVDSSSRMNRFRCNCPDNIIRRGTCKHMLFVALRVLKISEEQLVGLENGKELDIHFLHEVLAKVAPDVDEEFTAPAALKERLKSIAGDFETGGEVPKVEPRLPEEGDQCPICMDDLTDGLPLVHCGYGCGKGVHEECFERYKKAQFARFSKNEVADNNIRCVTCRMDWVVEPTGIIGPRGMLVGRRAINLADSMPEQFFNVEPSSTSNSRSTGSSSKRKAPGSRKTTKSKKSTPATKRSIGSKRASTSKNSSKVAGVSAGRVSKAKSARVNNSRKGTRQSKRIGKQEASATKVEPEEVTQSKRTRKTPARKVKTETKVVANKVSPTKKSIRKGGISKREITGKKEVSLAKERKARDARAARRNRARVTRSMA